VFAEVDEAKVGLGEGGAEGDEVFESRDGG